MSASYVRNMVEAWLKAPAVVTPFYPTINLEQNPSDPIWFTAEFDAQLRETITFCQNSTSEEGEIELFFFGAPGQGYTAVLTALETDLITLMANVDPAGKLVLTNASAPFDFSSGKADREYGLSVFLEYTYYS
jgi:hypothetical protein